MGEVKKVAAAEATAVLEFNTLYLDTNVLTESNWPAVSSRLGNLLSLASLCKVAVLIPEPVEKEAEEHWLRQVRSSLASIEGAARDFHRLCRGIDGAIDITLETEEELFHKYRQVVLSRKEGFGILSCPITSRPLRELFDLATRYVMPFEESRKGKGRGEGQGFQDAVILSSILEHVKQNPSISGALVSGDSGFSKVEIAEFMPSCADTKCLVSTLEEIVKKLFDTYLDEHIKRPWEEEQQNANKVVEAMVPELNNFVKERVQEIPLVEINARGYLDTLDSVLGVRSVKPIYVQTPVPDPEKPDRSVRMAIAITVDLDVSGTRSHFGALSFLAGFGAAAALSGQPQQATVTATWFGGIEAAAEVRARQFTDVKLLSLVSAEEIGSRKWFKAAAEGEQEPKPAAG